MKTNFLKTSSEETYKALLASKYTYIGKEGQYFCFINDGKELFDEKKVIQTNKLFMDKT